MKCKWERLSDGTWECSRCGKTSPDPDNECGVVLPCSEVRLVAGDPPDKVVYVVTSGSYSDYGIEGVFLDKALAEEFTEKLEAADYHLGCEIEEWPLGEAPIARVDVWGMWCWVREDGTVMEVSTGSPMPQVTSEWNCRATPKRARATTEAGVHAGVKFIHVRVEGRDKDAVVKAYHDKVAEVKAMVLGV